MMASFALSTAFYLIVPFPLEYVTSQSHLFVPSSFDLHFLLRNINHFFFSNLLRHIEKAKMRREEKRREEKRPKKRNEEMRR